MKGSISPFALVVTVVVILAAVAGGMGAYYVLESSDGNASGIPIIGRFFSDEMNGNEGMQSEGEDEEMDGEPEAFALENEKENIVSAILERVKIYSSDSADEMRAYNKSMFPTDAENIDALTDEEIISRGNEYAAKRSGLTRELLLGDAVSWSFDNFAEDSYAVRGSVEVSTSSEPVSVMAVKRNGVWY